MRIRILLTCFAVFKNRLLSQCKHSKKGTVRRDWNDVDNRNGRDLLEKRQRRETEAASAEAHRARLLSRSLWFRRLPKVLHSLSAYVLYNSLTPMSSISLVFTVRVTTPLLREAHVRTRVRARAHVRPSRSRAHAFCIRSGINPDTTFNVCECVL